MVGTGLLESVPLLSSLSKAELRLVAESARRLVYPRGSIVFHEGDPGDFLLVVLQGRVKVVLLGQGGQEIIINTLGRSGILGEVALLDDAPRSATVVTLERTEFLQMTRGPFLELLASHPSIALKVMRHLASELREASEQIRSLSMFDAHGRLVRCLLRLARQEVQTEGGRMVIRPRPAIQDLARMIGCSRETVSRSMKTLQDAGYVAVVERGLALEAKAVRRYLEPALLHMPASGGQAARPTRGRAPAASGPS